MQESQTNDFPNLSEALPIPLVVIGASIVKHMATQLSGVEDLSGFDFSMIHSWLICFGIASANLCCILVELATWIPSALTPWAAI